jgi:hypothetical protein
VERIGAKVGEGSIARCLGDIKFGYFVVSKKIASRGESLVQQLLLVLLIGFLVARIVWMLRNSDNITITCSTSIQAFKLETDTQNCSYWIQQ